ncbi:MAG: hypothetical protein ACOH15_00655 [Acetobacterium sp.]
MYQKDFIPVVFKVNFKSEQQLPAERWQALIGELLGNYAHQLSQKDGCVIGHIKALAEIEAVSFIKFSCVSALAGVNSEFHGKRQEIGEVNMVINSLVTNADLCESLILLEQSWLLISNQGLSIQMEIAEEALKPLEEHHHHEGEKPCPICNEQHHHHH